MPILFYSAQDPWGVFSNFYLAEIRIAGKVYPTTEHYFQAQKFLPADPEHAEKIRKAGTAGISKRLGNDRKHKLRPDWESMKDNVMRVALRAKFEQHPALKDLLLSTGDERLVEHTERDTYWADGGDGSGKNMLGKLLMELRASLKEDL